LLVLCTAFNRMIDEKGSIFYRGQPVFNTSQMVAALTGTTLACIAEVRFQQVDGEIIHCLSIPFQVDKTLIAETGVVPPSVSDSYPDVSTIELKGNRDQPGGYPSLDGNGKVSGSVLPAAINAELVTNKDQPDGYPGLDSAGLILPARIPIDGVTITVVDGKLVGAASSTAGPAGPTGPTGPAGAASTVPGPTGPTGPTGPIGQGLVIKGTVATTADLPATGNTAGDFWITSDTGHGKVWSGTAWVDTGAVQGPIGPTGPAGTDGATGPAGADGAPGPAGADGAPGATGPTGPAGADGSGGGGGAFDPATGVDETEDFFGEAPWKWGWTLVQISGGTAQPAAVVSGEPSNGIAALAPAGGSAQCGMFVGPMAGRNILVAQNPLTITWRMKLLGTGSGIVAFGLMAASNVFAPSNPLSAIPNGCFFRFDPPHVGDNNWHVAVNSAGANIGDTSMGAADTSWHEFKIAITTAGIVFSIDSTAVTIAYNAIAAPLSIGMFAATFSAEVDMLFDYVRLQQTLAR
jgi:hypothetical protein